MKTNTFDISTPIPYLAKFLFPMGQNADNQSSEKHRG